MDIQVINVENKRKKETVKPWLCWVIRKDTGEVMSEHPSILYAEAAEDLQLPDMPSMEPFKLVVAEVTVAN